MPSDTSSESVVRRAGRQLIFSAYGALRAVKLYPVENAAVQKALAELTHHSREMLASRGRARASDVGRIHLRQSDAASPRRSTTSRSFSHLLSRLSRERCRQLTVAASVTSKDWLIFLSLLQAPGVDDPAARLDAARGEAGRAPACRRSRSRRRRITATDDREKAKERAKRTYANRSPATRELMASVRMGGSPNIKKIKRVVQGIVDQILNEETSLIGLTTIRDYDEYTFTHSVNVCIFSVALGKRLGLSKLQLYDLGMAALFHDIGKSRVPQSILNKTIGLTDDEWRARSPRTRGSACWRCSRSAARRSFRIAR